MRDHELMLADQVKIPDWWRPLLVMASDLTLWEWSVKLGVPTWQIMWACALLGVRPAVEGIGVLGTTATEAPMPDTLDHLNDALTRAISKLIALDMGVPGEVELNSKMLLGFGKVDGKWTLYVRDPKLENRTPLLSSSKQHRLQAAGRLGRLHARLVEVWHAENGDVKRAIEQVNSAIGDMVWAHGAEIALAETPAMMEVVKRGEPLVDPTEEPAS